MFNYEDLSDVEFESLAKDIMEVKLGVDLHRFAKGRDGGIDLTDNVNNKQIVIQVKHYFRSSVASLISSLEKEVDKVRVLKPQRYFVVTSATLSAEKKDEIFQMFRDYMQDDSCVITREDIEDFLQNQGNIEVVKKHFKLWLHSTSVLELVTSGDIETDSQVCIEQIKQNEKVLVQTQAYYEAIKCLEATRILFITGAPGVGKTITAQMLVLKYISEGYRLRYSTDTTDLSALKKSVFMNRDLPEIILLDDCFGQYYFRMKETQDSELVSLIKHIKISSNKVLVLNSRLTILHEAKSISHEITRCIDSDELHVHVIDMNRISILDKAKILYNHLFFSNIPIEYFNAVKYDNFYMKIILHKNYTPRIIEHVTTVRHFASVQPAEYPQYILDVLNKPDEIWDNEYSKRIQQVDRVFLGTLFSLTSTIIDIDLFRNCFNYRLSLTPGIDLTEDNFKNCLSRLNMSMVKTVDDHGHKRVGVINPSVNDYIQNRLIRNKPEKDEIIASIACVKQAERLLLKFDEYLYKKFIDLSIFRMYFTTERAKSDFITAKVLEYGILDNHFSSYVWDYICNYRMLLNMEGYQISSNIEALKSLLSPEFYKYYNVSEVLGQDNVMANIFKEYDLDEVISAILMFFDTFSTTGNAVLLSRLSSLCNEVVKEAAENYGYEIDVLEESEKCDIDQIIDECTDFDNDTGEFNCDIYNATDMLEKELADEIARKICEKLSVLPASVSSLIDKNWEIGFSTIEIQRIIESKFIPDYDVDRERDSSRDEMMQEIDYMFLR